MDQRLLTKNIECVRDLTLRRCDARLDVQTLVDSNSHDVYMVSMQSAAAAVLSEYCTRRL